MYDFVSCVHIFKNFHKSIIINYPNTANYIYLLFKLLFLTKI